MCNSPQKQISCLVDPYFQYHCKDVCKGSQKLQDELGDPELFSLPALVIFSTGKEASCQNVICLIISTWLQYQLEKSRFAET